MAAPSKSFTVVQDTDIDAESPVDVDLMTGFRDNDIHLEEWVGLSYVAAQDHDHDGVNSAPVIGAQLELLASYSPSAVASVDITSVIVAGYKTFLIVFDNIVLDTNNRDLFFRTSVDNSTFDSGATDYRYAMGSVKDAGTGGLKQSTGSAEILISGESIGNAAGEGISGRVWISDPLNSALLTRIQFDCFLINTTGGLVANRGAGARNAASAVNAAQLLPSGTANITSGEIRVFGVREA